MEVSAEVHFAQTLASNEKKFRDRALKRLRKYISVRSCHGEKLSHEDYIKIWKGLHYCMWMQDKPVIQEELSKKMAELLHAFPNIQDALRFVNVFFITEAREWNGIDRLRLDKFMMLIRDILHETFVILSRDGWPLADCQSFSQYLTVSVMNEDNMKLPYGLKTHVADIYMAEFRKVSLDGINGKKLTVLMLPFIYFLLKMKRRELGLTMYNKTVGAVLNQFGKWPWQNKKSKKRKNKTMPVKTTEDEDDEEEEEMEEEEEEEMGSDDDEQEDEDEDMDMDEEPKLKFDMSQMLRLMFLLAEDPKVESRNRSYVYGIVQKYSSRDPSILNSSKTDTSGEIKAVVQNGDNSDDDSDIGISKLCHLTGEAEEKKIGKKNRRRRRKWEAEHGEGQQIISDTNNNIDSGEAMTQSSSQQKSPKQGKKKNNIKTANGKENDKQEDVASPSPKVKSKKRKRISSEGENVTTDVKKVKMAKSASSPVIDNDTSVSKILNSSITKTKKQKNKNRTSVEKIDSNCQTNVNINTNALSPVVGKSSPKSKKKNLSVTNSRTGLVVYPQKIPSAISLSSLAKTSLVKTGTTVSAKDSSPPRPTKSPKRKNTPSPCLVSSNSSIAENDGSSPAEKVGKTTRKAKTRASLVGSDAGDSKGPDNSSSAPAGLMDTLYNVVATPCNMIKKAVGMVTPEASPVVTKEKTAATPESLTPGGSKRVVFNLGKNKANKFKDYLKSLASDPPPAFEPSKSPSQGILKSPSVTSLSSPATNTPKGRRKSGGKAGTPKMAIQKVKSPKNRKSLSPGNKRKSIKL